MYVSKVSSKLLCRCIAFRFNNKLWAHYLLYGFLLVEHNYFVYRPTVNSCIYRDKFFIFLKKSFRVLYEWNMFFKNRIVIWMLNCRDWVLMKYFSFTVQIGYFKQDIRCITTPTPLSRKREILAELSESQ